MADLPCLETANRAADVPAKEHLPPFNRTWRDKEPGKIILPPLDQSGRSNSGEGTNLRDAQVAGHRQQT